ncbi:MAG: Rap1a/Tai family immunity protein [Pseudomonadales bacterium]
MRKSFVCSLSLMFGVFTTSLQAIEALPANELFEHCALYHEDPEGKDAIFCVRYIQGFIDGAIATDERVLKNLEAEYSATNETFSARAIRMRSSDRQRQRLLERFGASSYADICLGAPVPLMAVVQIVVENLNGKADQWPDNKSAREVVLATLTEHYPCAQ